MSQAYLGSCYNEGLGVECDKEQAVYWWKKSAEQGCTIAMGDLGKAYFWGSGVEQSMEQALFWYKKRSGSWQ